jgi:retron-type reverse transcriptase
MSEIKGSRYELDQSPFYCLQSKAKLAEILQINLHSLKELTRSDNLYIEKEHHDKKTGKNRLLEEPKPALKLIHKRIEDLLKRIKLASYVHAPTKGRSYITNAKVHINTKVVRSLDIEKYFLSTPARRIYWFFHKRMKCSEDVAGILTKITTFKDHLPTGSPSSPILSYFSHLDMWESIEEIVKQNNCNLTVYIDDVTISGDHVSDQLIWQIKSQFCIHGLSSSKKKERSYFNKSSCEVTGIIIKQGELKVPNRQHLKIYQARQKINLEIEPEERKKLTQKLIGLESQIKQVKSAND